MTREHVIHKSVVLHLAAICLAILLGLGLGGALAATPLQAQGCEQDECEHGWFWDSCVNNPGEQTGCDMWYGFPYYFCRTYACQIT